MKFDSDKEFKWFCIYLVSFLFSWILIYGMLFAESQNRWPLSAGKNYRKNMGESVLFSFLNATIWPIGLPINYCMTGFAEFGLKFK